MHDLELSCIIKDIIGTTGHLKKHVEGSKLYYMRVSSCFFVFLVLGFELRDYTLSHSTNLFLMGVFQIGSPKLFWADFKPWSSWSLPLEWLGLQAWPPARSHFLVLIIFLWSCCYRSPCSRDVCLACRDMGSVSVTYPKCFKIYVERSDETYVVKY
jgi:hypothetical protein